VDFSGNESEMTVAKPWGGAIAAGQTNVVMLNI